MVNTETNRELVYLYCIIHKLDFCSHDTLAAYWGGEEEWEGVRCAGVDEMGTPFIIQEDDGRVKVVSAYADGRRRMEDEWRYVTTEDLRGAGTQPLHAV